MEKYYNKCAEELEEKIQEIELDNPILLSQEMVRLLIECLGKLKWFVLSHDFKNIEEEIYFFKRLKPTILARLIYHEAIYKIETAKPLRHKPVKIYLDNELEKLKKFYSDNLDFCKYYRSHQTHQDEEHFLRDIKLDSSDNYFETDHVFSTSHDYKAAKILAYDLLREYIENYL